MMTGRGLVALVARREVRARIRTKTFVIGTVVLALLPAAAIVVPALVGDDDERTDEVGLVGDAPPELLAAISASLLPGVVIDTHVIRDEATARAVLSDGDLDAAVVDGTRLLTTDDPHPDLVAYLREAVTRAGVADRLRASGLGATEVTGILDQPPVPIDEVAPREAVRDGNRPVAFIGLLFVYLMILGYGTNIATAVLEEKTSRVSEVLLGTVRPHQLLAGKVTGVGLLALIQVLVVGAASAVAALSVGSSIDVPAGSPLTFLAIGMWTVLGFSLYACAFAAAGATASRPEEVGSVTFPLTAIVMASYFASFGAIAEPNGGASRVLSFVPPMAPMTMLPRAAVGDVAPWEVPLSVALVLAFTYGLIKLAGRIYSGGILRTGGRVKLRDAWRGAEG